MTILDTVPSPVTADGGQAVIIYARLNSLKYFLSIQSNIFIND